MRNLLVCFLLTSLILATCSPAPGPGAATPTPEATAAPDSTDLPTLEVPEATSAPTATLPPRPSGPLTAPALLDRYALDGQQGVSIAAGGGKVWAGTATGAVIEFDAASGEALRTYTLAEGSTADPAPVQSLAYDGARVWALVRSTREGTLYKTLAVLDPASGETVDTFDVTDDDPDHLLAANGQVWMQNRIWDARTLESAPLPMATDSSVFAWDGQGMWVGGAATTCDTCEQMLYRYAGGTLSAGPAASQQVLGLVAAGERLWVLTGFNTLDGYTLGAGLEIDSRPEERVELSGDHDTPPAAILFDGTRLWLLGAAGKGSGRVFYHDPASGKKLGGVMVGDSSEAPFNASIPMDLAYDGTDLWVLTALHLVRVGLPE